MCKLFLISKFQATLYAKNLVLPWPVSTHSTRLCKNPANHAAFVERTLDTGEIRKHMIEEHIKPSFLQAW